MGTCNKCGVVLTDDNKCDCGDDCTCKDCGCKEGETCETDKAPADTTEDTENTA